MTTRPINIERTADDFGAYCGQALLCIQYRPIPLAQVSAFDTAGLDLAAVLRDMPAVAALLADPRVQEEIVRAGRVTPDRRREIARAFPEFGGEPPTLEIERHERDERGEPYGEPWTSYTFGDASIDIGDRGNGNLCIYGQLVNFRDFGPLRDLAALLSHPTMAAALAPVEDERIEIGCEADAILRAHFAKDETTSTAPDSPLLADLKGWVDEHTRGGTHAPDGTPLAVPGTHGGVFVSEGVTNNLNSGDTPQIRPRADGVLCIGYDRSDLTPERRALADEEDPPQPIVEVVRLKTFGLVIVSTQHEVHLLSESEWSRQV
jgi:hypothetical protein